MKSEKLERFARNYDRLTREELARGVLPAEQRLLEKLP